MPSNAGRNTLSRQWELLKLLPTTGSGATARSLQTRLAEAGFPTTKRTVERDLEELATVFAIRKNDKSVPFGFSWTPPTSNQAASITVLEALTLELVNETLIPLIPAFMLNALQPRFEQAHTKLSALAQVSPAAKWLDKVASVPAYLPLVNPKIDPKVLAEAQECLLGERQLHCTYFAAHRNHKSQMVINPLGMIQRGAVTYLIATISPDTKIRQLALHRMTDVQGLDTLCQIPDGFNLKDYARSGAMQLGDNTGQVLTIEAWVSEGLLRLLRETPLSEDMEIMSSDDGGWIRATVPDTWELEWWLLSHTGSIVITAPHCLKERLLNRLKRGMELYEE